MSARRLVDIIGGMKALNFACCAAALLVGRANSSAIFVQPEPVPIERLLKSAEAYVVANPDSAEGHYTLGRIHYLAFIRSSQDVPAIVREGDPLDAQGKPWTAPDWQMLPENTPTIDRRAFELALKEVGLAKPPHPRNEREKFGEYHDAYKRHLVNLQREEYRRQLRERWTDSTAISDEKAMAHVTAALGEFRVAIRLPREHKLPNRLSAPEHGLYELSLASLMEQFADWKLLKKPAGLSAELKKIDHHQARDAYLAAFRIAYPHDSGLENRPIEGFAGLVSYEAGWGFLRLAEMDPQHSQANSELARDLAEVKTGLAKVGRLKFGAITPILFSMQAGRSIEQLLAPKITVDFDLRGYGPKERWPWVKPDTALLVWDPECKSEIVSGRQLIGSFTFGIFWRNGFAALAALDHDHDGWLRGSELDGLRAWFDADGNGRSTVEEVRNLDELGITGIATCALRRDGSHPTHPYGLELSNGQTLPTWDWIVESVATNDTADTAHVTHHALCFMLCKRERRCSAATTQE